MKPVSVRKFQQLTQEEAVAAGGTLEASRMSLYSNEVDVTPNTVEGDLDIVVQIGMANRVVTWSAPYQDASGQWVVSTDAQVFVATAPLTVPLTIYGYLIENGGSQLIIVCPFDEPIPINAALQGFTLVATIPYGC